MSADPANLAAAGAAALSAQNYALAVEKYSAALDASPTSVDYYIKRSTAYQRAGNYDLALTDAELAVELAHKRGARELIGTAQLRRGITLLLMEQYGDAGLCFAKAEIYNAGEKSIPMWQKKLETSLAKCDEEDPRREVTIKEIPSVTVPKKVVKKESARVEELPDDYEETPKEKVAPRVEEKKTVPPPPEGVTMATSKIRHEWYQTANAVVVSLFVKGVPKDKATVDLQEQSLSITFPLATGADWTFDLDPLCHTIDVTKSTYKVLGTKVEFDLIKSEPNRKWATLESTVPVESTTTTTKPADAPPVYPTSSKAGPKNWDKVVSDLKTSSKSKSKDKDTEKKAEGDDEVDYGDIDDEFGNDPVNGFFKQLFKGADPDTQRAMMKSYTESNGTALSTNWSEVGRGKVETSPPEGMVAKKWGE